jgi:hypothetical protein
MRRSKFKLHKLKLELGPDTYKLLAAIDPEVSVVIDQLIDHAMQGVYRPGAWERDWLRQAFGDDFVSRLEPGDPFGRPGREHVFQKPISTR